METPSLGTTQRVVRLLGSTISSWVRIKRGYTPAQRRTAFLLQAWAPKAQVKLGVRPTRFCPVSQDRATRRKADIIAANSRCLPAKGTGNVEGQIRERDWAIR